MNQNDHNRYSCVNDTLRKQFKAAKADLKVSTYVQPIGREFDTVQQLQEWREQSKGKMIPYTEAKEMMRLIAHLEADSG